VTIKIADSKGRIMLGSHFAGQMVLIDDSNPDEIVITPAVAIPAREAWLYKNEKALQMVRKGLEQAANGEFSDRAPDLDSDAAFVKKLED
jgi:hypothetical protein